MFGGKHALDSIDVDVVELLKEEPKDKLKPIGLDMLDIAPPSKKPSNEKPPEIPKKHSITTLEEVEEVEEEINELEKVLKDMEKI